jgi:hypothetical protein
MKKNLNKCKCWQTVKRCVFKVPNSGKQEKLQTRTLLSEQDPHLGLNRYKQPSSWNTAADFRTLSSNETALTTKVFENITVH